MIWKTMAIGSGALTLAGAGLIWHSHGRKQELSNETDDQIYNQRVRTEGNDIVTNNNIGLIMLTVGGGAFIASMYQLLSSLSDPSTTSSRSRSISFKSDPFQRFAGFEMTW